MFAHILHIVFFILLYIFYHERNERTFLIIIQSCYQFVIDFIIMFLFNEFLKLNISMKSMSKFDSSVD